jgi:hypothetical protein
VIFCKGDKIFTFVCSYFIAEDVNIMWSGIAQSV